MQKKIEASCLEADAGEIATVSRRSFLAGSTATTVIASTLATGEASAAEAGFEGVTPALARLADKLQAASAERRRLGDIDDEAHELYFRTAPPIPAPIAAPVDDEGYVLHGFKHKYYAQRSRNAGSASGSFVLSPPHWRAFGDEERARIAEDFIAADRAAREAAGCDRTNAAEVAQWDAVDQLEDEIERFPLRSFADLVVLARMAQSQIDFGRDLSDDMPKILIGHIVRLAGQQLA